MDFRHRLSSFFASFTRTRSEPGQGREIGSDEPLTRFVFEKKWIDKANKGPKPDAFLPIGTPLQTSVFRIARLSDKGTWEIGASVAKARQRSLKARADFPVNALDGTPLRLDPDNNPPRHANILGWPEEKSDQLLLASILANESQLSLPPVIGS